MSQRLVDQMVPVRAGPGMRRFITGTWAKVLAEVITRDGEMAESTHGYIKLVDELLWSLQLPDHPKSRQRLIGLLPEHAQAPARRHGADQAAGRRADAACSTS